MWVRSLVNVVMFVRQYRTEAVLRQLCEGEPVRVWNDGSKRWSLLPAGGGTAVPRRLPPGTLSPHHYKNLIVSIRLLIQEKIMLGQNFSGPAVHFTHQYVKGKTKNKTRNWLNLLSSTEHEMLIFFLESYKLCIYITFVCFYVLLLIIIIWSFDLIVKFFLNTVCDLIKSAIQSFFQYHIAFSSQTSFLLTDQSHIVIVTMMYCAALFEPP